MMRTHYNLATFVFEAFKISNESRLSKVASLVGAHRSAEAVETSSLASFLLEHFSARGEEPVSFCLQTSDMAGLARLASTDSAVALENMPIIVELGDIGI